MNVTARFGLLLVLPTIWLAPDARGQDRLDPVLRASLVTSARHFRVGEPIYVDFRISNLSGEAQPLIVPGTTYERAEDAMGLPISHVFSGEGFGALSIRNAENRTWNVAHSYRPPAETPIVTLAPRSSIGATLDITEFYPALNTPGRYWIRWAPYGGRVVSDTLFIVVDSLKQAVIVTDVGEMAVAFHYDVAPNHVENFIGLAKDKFYNNLTFHRVEPGYFIQGGCPTGDGTGIRPDGVKLDGEFSDKPQIRGSVSMALLGDDPDSASCQFFVTNTRIPDWDGRYTTFGQLIGDKSFDTLDALMSTDVDASGKPEQRVYIRSIRIVDVPHDVDLTDPDLVAPRPSSTNGSGISQRAMELPGVGGR